MWKIAEVALSAAITTTVFCGCQVNNPTREGSLLDESKKRSRNELIESAPKKPNIVYVLTDEWRAKATGYAGDPNVQTPNLDALASQCVNFSNAVSVLPVCTPHRAALLTGKYPESTGMIFNDLYLPAEENTMAEIFKNAGYRTAYIGKWHLDGHGRQTFIPRERRQGFEYWKANECSHNYNNSRYFDNDDTTAKTWNGYDVYAQTSDAQDYIRSNAKGKQPFLMVVAYGTPHFPHDQAPPHLKKLYENKMLQLPPNVPDSLKEEVRKEAIGYYAHCTALDSCIGALRRSIREAAIEDNTIFIFTSDHGEMLGAHGVHPEAKQRPWDESIRVPFLISYPSATKQKPLQIRAPINTPDILPTLLGLTGISIPSSIQGEDLSAAITGKKILTDRTALFMNLSPFSENFGGDEFRGIRTMRYTFVRNLKGPWMLYDNERDPYQLQNLVNDPKYKAIQSALEKELSAQLAKRGDTFEPKEYYVKKWGFKLKKNKGEIAYGPGPYEPQSPRLSK